VEGASTERRGRTGSERQQFHPHHHRSDVEAGRTRIAVTRFPPEPNGYLHLGHAKSIVLNYELAKEFGGRCNLRLDDTNPAKEQMEYIDTIKRDVQWLGFDWAQGLRFASDYFKQLYAWACHLVHIGKACVDDQSVYDIREGRGTLTSPGREQSVPRPQRGGKRRAVRADARRRVQKRRTGAPRENRHDVSEHQPARPVIYRILNASHPRTGGHYQNAIALIP
jgi:glutaminyl-tRNA synthetase